METTKKEWKTAAELSAEIREKLKNEFPHCKFSVTCENYSGGRAITVSLMSAPFQAIVGDRRRVFENGQEVYRVTPPRGQYAQLNHHYFEDYQAPDTSFQGIVSNGAILSLQCGDVMKKAVQIAQFRNWDNSDIQTDYFDVNFYLHLNIGRYDKDFQTTN